MSVSRGCMCARCEVYDPNVLSWVAMTQPGTSAGGGGTGDASAANQTTEITKLTSIDTKLSGPLAVSGPLTDTQIRANPLSVSLASVPSHPVTNTGTFAVQVTSVPTTTVTGTITANVGTGTQPVSAVSLPLPSGASTEATLSAIKVQTDKLTFTGTALQVAGGTGGSGGGDGAILDGTNAALKAKVDAGGRLYVKTQADPTWYIWVPALACAQNKLYLSFLNTGAQKLRLKKLFLQNAQLAAITGVGIQFDFLHGITAISGGTAVTPRLMDSVDAALTGITCVHTATSVTGGNTVFSWFTNNDEIGLTGGFPQATIQGLISIMPEGSEIKEPCYNQNEGFALKLITSTAVGAFGVLAVVTRDS